jgi:hypothetical protein
MDMDGAGPLDAEEGQPLTYSVPEAGKMINPPLGKNAAYRAADRGEIPTLRFGHLLRVPGKKWRRMLDGEGAK